MSEEFDEHTDKWSAEVEQSDRTYKIGWFDPPKCGEEFCDTCGDCLVCDGGYCSGGCRWVIYLENPRNPNYRSK